MTEKIDAKVMPEEIWVSNERICEHRLAYPKHFMHSTKYTRNQSGSVAGLLSALETSRHDFNQIISETDMNIKMAIAHDAAIDITEALAAYRKENGHEI
jgi:hypothetical protein